MTEDRKKVHDELVASAGVCEWGAFGCLKMSRLLYIAISTKQNYGYPVHFGR